MNQPFDRLDPSDPTRGRYRNEEAKDPRADSSWGKLLFWVPDGARVLEIGCAHGSFSAALKSKKGCRIFAVELDPSSASDARPYCEQVVVGDITELLRAERLPKDFDVIVAADVLEHLLAPLETLHRLSRLLRPGGFLLSSVPNVTHLSILAALAQGSFPRSSEGLLDSAHVQFYGEADLLALFGSADYAARIVDRVRKDPRLTEFRTDLSAIPPAVLDYFDRNPNSSTYQFIVKAVPLAWASESDQLPPRQENDPLSVVKGVAAELLEAHAQLAQYHDIAIAREQKLSEQQTELVKYHCALGSREAEVLEAQRKIAEYQAAMAAAREKIHKYQKDIDTWSGETHHLTRMQMQGARPLSVEERGRLRVLFITDREDAPYRYRCLHACEQLRAAGVVANIRRFDSPDLLTDLSGYSLVILSRLGWSNRTQEIIQVARGSGAKVGFDIDDLIFRPEQETLIPFLPRLPRSTVEQYRTQLSSLHQTLLASDFCLAATPVIAKHAAYEHKPSILHPNLLSHNYLRLASIIYPMRPALLRDELIGYMSGSRTHDGDLEHVAPALRSLLESRTGLRLLICGPVGIPLSLKSVRAKVVRVSYQDYRVYPWLMARCRAVIAPIEVVNDFTNAKSALKVFEAAVFGIPVVASPLESYVEAIEHGRSGFIARSTDEWVEGLSKLLDWRTSLDFGRAARQLALREYSPHRHRFLLARNLLRHSGAGQGGVPEVGPLQPHSQVSIETLAEVVRLGRVTAQIVLGDPDIASIASDDPFMERLVEPEVLKTGSNSSKWLACSTREGNHLMVGDQDIGVVLADREHPISRFHYNEQVEPLSDSLTAGTSFQIAGSDPMFILEGFPQPSSATFFALEMRARSRSEAAFGQLFFSADGQLFNERDSCRFPLVADGQPRTYVVRIPEHLKEGKFESSGYSSVRFDPLDQPGDIEITRMAVLSSRPAEDQPVDLRRELADRFLRGRGIEIGALQNPLRVPPGAAVQYVDRLTLDQARAEYPELSGQKLVQPSIIAEAEILGTIEAETQDFAICNHVLEHMKDPIGALKQWIRVLKPGGRLYVSIPDHTNVLDQHRSITSFEHLLRDHRARAACQDADQDHYWDFTRSAHREMSSEALAKFTAGLIAKNHSIHFHAFDQRLFEQLLAYVCSEEGVNTVEFLPNEDGGSLEYIGVLEKQGGAALQAHVRLDVVIPIFNSKALTRRCVESVLRHATGDWRLVLVNDASTEPGLKEELEQFSRADSRVIVLENETNLGFIKTANRGMREANGRDVLLLNSDTEVFADFMDRLGACAYADATTGVVSPLSNNATLCSVPEMGKDNPIPEGFTAESFAELIAAASRRRRPELPTAVGFCMYVKSAVFEEIGYFDEIFGRGFGEENDFCERAKKSGFQVRLCDDVFVLHKGKASFGDEGLLLEASNGRLLEDRQPGYHAAVARFFEENPLAPLHDELRFQIHRLGGRRTAPLYVLHASPFAAEAGGVELHVRDLLKALALPRAVVAYPDGRELIFAEVLDGDIQHPLFYRFPLSKAVQSFSIENQEVLDLVRRTIALFGISGVHIHHLLSWPLSLPKVCAAAGLKVVYTCHDYYCVCPSWNLFDHSTGKSCECKRGDGGDAGCLPALTAQLGTGSGVDLSALRRKHREIFLDALNHIDAWVFPSSAASEVAMRHLPIDRSRARVIGHGCDQVRTAQRREKGSVLRLGVLGEVTYPIKGAENYIEIARRTSGLPVEWHFFGTTSLFRFEERIRQTTTSPIEFHGRYQRAEIANKLARSGIDLSVLLPKVDETFSLVLSESLVAGIPALTLAKGALPERLVKQGLGVCVADLEEAARWIEKVSADRTELVAMAEQVRKFKHTTLSDNAAAHRQVYEGLGFFRAPQLRLPLTLPELFSHSDAWRARRVEAPRVEQAPKYQATSWYPAFLRLKPWVPKAVRTLGRKALVRLEHRRSTKLNPREVANLRVVQRGLRHSRYKANGPDPQIVFAAHPFAPQSVTRIRFRLRHDFQGPAYAQLFWRHSADEGFSERKSLKVTLESVPGEWREYTFRLDEPRSRPKWEAGREIVQLRFDPINVPAGFEMSPLELLV